jgi:putative Mg2+ transporter-C (MgtC) family protein
LSSDDDRGVTARDRAEAAGGAVLGGALGLERSYHGRPAGFRTHALVGLASSALMLVSVYESVWFQAPTLIRAAIDPTRMAQGLMTGIGFLGAGVIMRERLTVRGLTTAASIWLTAGIGILVGIGFFTPAALTTVIALAALSGFRWIERHVRTGVLRAVRRRLRRGQGAQAGRAAGAHQGARVRHLGRDPSLPRRRRDHGIRDDAPHARPRRLRAPLAETLRGRPDVVEFRVAPTGD